MNTEMFNKIFSVFSMILLSMGVLGNMVTISACCREELRKVPTFIFMGFISVINVFKLITIVICIMSFQFLIVEMQTVNSKFYVIAIYLIFWQSHSTVYLQVWKKLSFFY